MEQVLNVNSSAVGLILSNHSKSLTDAWFSALDQLTPTSQVVDVTDREAAEKFIEYGFMEQYMHMGVKLKGKYTIFREIAHCVENALTAPEEA